MRPLIDTATLATHLCSSVPPVLLDVRWRLAGPPARPDYLRAHLPGAVFLDLDSDLAAHSADPTAGRHPMPSAGDLQRTLRAAGVCTDRAVVVYDDADGSVAARAWWLLRWAGHRDVVVLDGGYAAWAGEDRPREDGEQNPEPGDITVHPGQMPTVDAHGAAGLPARGTLLDARAPARYAGETEPIDPRAGHIPGARNAPFAGHVGADGRWLSASEMAERFGDLGVPAADSRAPVGVYCGSGVTACSVVLALEHAGLTTPHHPAALYPASWSGWSAEQDRPAATGHEPG